MIKSLLSIAIVVGLLMIPSCSLIEEVAGNGEDWPEGDILMIAPFVNQGDIASINEAYSAHGSCPWGFEHRAIDFNITRDHIPFQAVCDGVITRIDSFLNTGNGFWQVNVQLKYNETFTVHYAFEPFTPSAAGGEAQLNDILVSEGDQVLQGDLIGYLGFENPGAHVDFSLTRQGESVCPESCFTPAAAQQIYTLLHRVYPGAAMCYE